MVIEVPLPAGRMTQGITRRGGEVLRPAGPWTAAVHEFLAHLDKAGFAGAPRVVEVEAGREILTFIDGDVPVDPHWEPGRGHLMPTSEAALTTAARLIRQLHDAASTFKPEKTAYRFHPYAPRPHEIISHGDLGPWNTVYRDGLPVAFIDWDAAGPVDPLVELAAAAWEFVPLGPPGLLRQAGFDPVPDVRERLRLFVDAYGVEDRQAFRTALRRSRLWKADQVAESVDAIEHRVRELRWLHYADL